MVPVADGFRPDRCPGPVGLSVAFDLLFDEVIEPWGGHGTNSLSEERFEELVQIEFFHRLVAGRVDRYEFSFESIHPDGVVEEGLPRHLTQTPDVDVDMTLGEEAGIQLDVDHVFGPGIPVRDGSFSYPELTPLFELTQVVKLMEVEETLTQGVSLVERRSSQNDTEVGGEVAVGHVIIGDEDHAVLVCG